MPGSFRDSVHPVTIFCDILLNEIISANHGPEIWPALVHDVDLGVKVVCIIQLKALSYISARYCDYWDNNQMQAPRTTAYPTTV